MNSRYTRSILVALTLFAATGSLTGCAGDEMSDPSLEDRAALALSKAGGGSDGDGASHAAHLNDAGDAYCADDQPNLCAPVTGLRRRLPIECSNCSGGITVCCTISSRYPVEITCVRVTCSGTGKPDY